VGRGTPDVRLDQRLARLDHGAGERLVQRDLQRLGRRRTGQPVGRVQHHRAPRFVEMLDHDDGEARGAADLLRNAGVDLLRQIRAERQFGEPVDRLHFAATEGQFLLHGPSALAQPPEILAVCGGAVRRDARHRVFLRLHDDAFFQGKNGVRPVSLGQPNTPRRAAAPQVCAF